MQSSRHSISVCLGLSSQKEAVNSPFLNATTSNVVTRTPVPVKTVVKPIEPTQSQLTKPLETPTPSTANNSSEIGSDEQHIGGVVGGVVCGVFGGVVGGSIPLSGGIPGVILGATLGAGIGWIAGEIIVTKTGELLGSITSSQNTDSDINQIQYPNSNSQSNSQRKNQNFGLKPTDNSDNQLDDKNQDSQKKPDNWF
jgi:predicted lipid-binding transport protein (Tim44 family)